MKVNGLEKNFNVTASTGAPSTPSAPSTTSSIESCTGGIVSVLCTPFRKLLELFQWIFNCFSEKSTVDWKQIIVEPNEAYKLKGKWDEILTKAGITTTPFQSIAFIQFLEGKSVMPFNSDTPALHQHWERFCKHGPKALIIMYAPGIAKDRIKGMCNDQPRFETYIQKNGNVFFLSEEEKEALENGVLPDRLKAIISGHGSN